LLEIETKGGRNLDKLRISSRVFAVSFLLVLAGITMIAAVSSLVFIKAMRYEMDEVVSTAADGIGKEIDSTINRMKVFGQVFTDMDELGYFIEKRDTYSLNKMLLPYLKISGFDTITVTDADGVVLSRPHEQNVIGDNVSVKGYIGPALEGRDALAIERGTTISLGLFYGVPVTRGSSIVGSIASGVNLGKSYLFDQLASMYRADLSLYYGDIRVNSTLIENGRRLTSTRADPAVANAVLKRGESYYGKLDLADGRELRTLNKPFVFNGKMIGMLSAGVSTLPLNHAIAAAITRVAATGAVFTMIAMWLSWLFAKNISKLSAEKTKQEIFLDRLMKNSPDAILIFDAEGRFIDCTDAFLKQAGIAGFDQIRGRLFSEVLADLLGASQTAELAGIFTRSMLQRKNISPDNTISFGNEDDRRSYTVRFTPMIDADDKTIGCMAMFHDLTEYLQARRAEAASQAKSAFLANISHEIRTPLNAVIGLSEIELQNSLPVSTHNNIETIYRSGTTLLGIINDILDISKIESGKFEINPAVYDFSNLISDTIHLNIVRIASKPIIFEPQISEDIPAKLYGDEIRIKQILNNILSNAFKYTSKGKVRLKITCERHANDAWMEYVVSDTGIGIKKEDIENIFTEYRQLDTNTNRKIEGTGLGLSICKNLVSLMEGTIDVESEYGMGSVFTVRIRQKIEDPSPIGIETAQNLKTFRLMDSHTAKNLSRTKMPYGKILIVDDVITNLDVAKGLMAPYELTIHTASSGKRAIEMIREEKTTYDAIFMDHMMPDMDGIETVRIIRGEIGTEYARNVPVIALTANALVDNENMFLENGFQGYISKPIDVVKLDALLNKWILGKRREATEQYAGEETISDSSARSIADEFQIDGLAISSGISRFGGEELYLKVLHSYVTNTPPLLDKARGVDEKSLSEYAVMIHGIKGACAGISADAAERAAQELEFAAKRGDIDAVRAQNGPFIQIAEKLIADISAMLKTASSSPAKEHRSAPDKAALKKMLECCRRYDVTGMEEAMSEIERYKYESGNDLAEWLRKRLDNLEYDQILAKLEEQAGLKGW
jgi:signal transduction histidine kinase/CheY-like chemotaxis protein